MMNTTYAAFLRGINVGGKMVKMATLREMFENLGYIEVKTLLNSGNVVFTAKNNGKLRETIEKNLEKTFGFPIDTIVRNMEEIKTLISSDPFKGITVTPKTRLYITFLANPSTSTLKIPYESPEKDFRILQVTDTEICSVLDLSLGTGTTDAMNIIEKEFGKKVTTRNWNTILKISALPQ
jgi:uncharacterized protein (DUF1697 family)